MDDRLNRVLLDLHGRCRSLAPPAFMEWALDLAAELVRFRHAHWGTAVMVDGAVQSLGAHIRGLDPGYEQRFNASVHLDAKTPIVVQNAGRTFLRDGCDPLDCAPEYHQVVLAPAGVRYGAVTAIVDGQSGLLEGLSLLREASEGPFTEAEREIVERLVPHLSQARLANVIARAQDVLDAGLRASYHTVVATPHGVVSAVEGGALALLMTEWPDWRGGRLPQPLVQAVAAVGVGPAGGFWRGKSITVRLHASSGQVLLRLREPTLIDSLAARELSVAEQFAAGRSYKEIARTLNTSPSTVSNQLVRVYDKLGISSKSALVRLLDQWR